LIRRGVIAADESLVVCITGNGYKTATETIGGRVQKPVEIGRSLEEFEAYLRREGLTAGAASGAAARS
jgi:hypothetical protein